MAEFGETRVALQLTPAALRAVRCGHPWIFDQGIAKQKEEAATGTLAVLFDDKRRFAGIGLYDPGSPIRVRMLHQGQPQTIDRDWLRDVICRAIARRQPLIDDPRTDGFRLIHGENDGLPGWVLDVYARTAVLKIYTSAWLAHLGLLQTLITELWDCERLLLRLGRNLDDCGHTDGSLLRGPVIDTPLTFHENGICFEVDPVAGQKTGFFLDQRDNRARVERLSRGRDVLNVFSYTGGFSLCAARGGARSVTSLDISAPALEAAVRNFSLNPELRQVPHHCLREDAFDGLTALAAQPRRFGLVILDPPSFTRKQSEIPRALAAYRRLCRLGLDILHEDGILVTASCSARVTADDFYAAISSAVAEAGRSLHEIERCGHAMDHPISFPEGAYLKCLFSQVGPAHS